jgi:hypothetical protein
LASRPISIIPLAILYGFNQKTPQGKNQQAQTAQEAAPESSQEAHLAEVILRCASIHPFAGGGSCNRPRTVFYVCDLRAVGNCG